MRHLITIVLLFQSVSWLAQTLPGKSGTITIEKDQNSITGLYKKTNVVANDNIDNIRGKLQKSENSYGAVNSNYYLYFLNDGRLYQIESTEKQSKVLDLAKNNPTKLRPVLASYALSDSVVIITPMQEGIKDAMEPTKAYYEGIMTESRLFLTKRQLDEVFIFEKVKE